MTSQPNLLARLGELAKGRFGERAAALKADDDLFDTLGIDSLAALDLLTDLEEAFDVEIPDYEVAEVRSLRDLAVLLEERL
jgi:acyl carrier protein